MPFFVLSSTVTPTGGGEFITLPADPNVADAVLINQNVFFAIHPDDITGYGGNVRADLSVFWDFGDAGATLESGGGAHNDANRSEGWATAHAYHTAGSKAATFTIRDPDGVVVAQDTIDITVTDPDNVSWDHDLLISFANNTSGWPAEGAGVHHITSVAELGAYDGNISAGDKTRLTFRDDEVYLWSTTDSFRILGDKTNLYYIGRDGLGTNKPIIRNSGTASTVKWTLFPNINREAKIAASGIRLEGGYSAVTGDAPNGLMTGFECGKPFDANGEWVLSMHRVEGEGLKELIAGGSNGVDVVWTVHPSLSVTDCQNDSWQNYTISPGRPSCYTALVGNRFQQSPLAMLRDTKTGSIPEASDHSAGRCGAETFVGIENNNTAAKGGWSPGSGTYAVNNSWRIYPGEHPAGHVTSVWNNRGQSDRVFIEYGSNDIGELATTLGYFMAGKNYAKFGVQSREMYRMNGISNVYIRDSISYCPAVYLLGASPYTVRFTGRTADGSPAALEEGEVYVDYITSVSDRSVASGGTDAAKPLEFDSDWAGTGIPDRAVGHIALIPGHSNSGDYTDVSALSRFDDWKPVTGSAAINAITTGFISYDDIDGVIRGATTNSGAHGTSVASDAGVAAPVYVSGLTIAENTAYSGGEYYVSTKGVWNNVTADDEWMFEYDWKIGGVSIAESFRTRVNVTDDSLSGSLTCTITATNLSGVRVSATSNSIAV